MYEILHHTPIVYSTYNEEMFKMKYDASIIELTEQEIKEYKETLATHLVALRKMLYLSQTEFGNRTGISRIRLSMIECGKYEMTWSQFTSILFVFFLNRSTKQIIIRKNLFPDKLYAYLQCKHIDEDIDGFCKLL